MLFQTAIVLWQLVYLGTPMYGYMLLEWKNLKSPQVANWVMTGDDRKQIVMAGMVCFIKTMRI